MNKLSVERRCRVVSALVEGNSIRATARMTDVSKPTILKLIAALGPVCAEYQDAALRGLTCRRIQCDEIWQFCYAKEKNVPASKRDTFGYGNVWTWVALDAETKLVPTWLVGPRDGRAAYAFMMDLAGRLRHRVQITTDGHRPYIEAIEAAFGMDVDFAQLIKVYGEDRDGPSRYSPGHCKACFDKVIQGDPNPAHVSTSYVERQNLTMRMNMRRFTRLTNGFSKKIENHGHAVAIHFMHYNFVRIHRSIRCTPAMKAGVSDTLWSVRDIVTLLEELEAQKAA